MRDPNLERLDFSVRFFTYALVLCSLAIGLFALGIALMIRNEGPVVLGLPVSSLVTLGCAISLLFHGLLVLKRRLR